MLRFAAKCLYVYGLQLFVIAFGLLKPKGRKILLMRLDAMGDFVLWLDSAREYKRLFPDQKIILLVNRAWAMLARRLPYWDEVWAVDVKKFRFNVVYRLVWLLRVRMGAFKLVLQPRFSRDFLMEDSIVLASGAQERISFEGDTSNIDARAKKLSGCWYTQLWPNPPASWGELRRNAEFVRKLGAASFKAGVARIEPMEDIRPNLGIPEYYVVCPGAGRRFRSWSVENFTEVCHRTHQTTGMTGIICGSTDEKELGQRLQGICQAPLIDKTGQTDLLEFIEIVRSARVVISNETAAVHLAAAVGTKSICITGGGHFRRFVPYQTELEPQVPLPVCVYHTMECYNCGWQCKFDVPQGRCVPCIDQVTVEQVWKKIEEMACR